MVCILSVIFPTVLLALYLGNDLLRLVLNKPNICAKVADI